MYSYDSTVDKGLLINNGKRIFIDDFNISNQKGYFILNYRGIDWHILYLPGKTDRMVVSLSAGGKRREGQAKFFRWSFNDIFDCTQLCIEDPMYSIYGVPTGWFFGNKDEDYCVYVSEIIDLIKKQLNISEVIFWSSSAGGTANIRVANILNYGLVVSFCPQTDISKHYKNAVDSIESVIQTRINEDPLKRNISILEGMRNDGSVKYIFIENSYSDKDKMYANLVANKYKKTLSLGINYITDNFIIWLYEADDGIDVHICQDWRALVPLLMHAFNEFWINNRIPLWEVSLINLIWHNRFAEIKKIREKEKSNICILPYKIDISDREYNSECIEKEELYSKENNFNYLKYYLKKDKLYQIELLCESENTDEFSVVLYDFRIKQNIYKKEYRINQKMQLTFVTGNNFENEQDVGLLIYAGKKGETKGKKVLIEELKIIVIDNSNI